MKVLHIIDTLWLGGAQTLLKSLFEASKTDENIYLYALRKTDPQIGIGHKNVICDKSSAKFSFLRIFRLKRFIRESNIDIIHCHLPHSQVFGFVLKKIFFRKLKLIVHEHSDIYEKGWLLPKLLSWMRKKVDMYIACSDSVKQKLIERTLIDQGQIVVIRNFMDKDRLNINEIMLVRDENRLKEGLSKDDFVIGYAGRIVERKGWREFVLAANQLSSEKQLHFYLAGTGPEEDHLKELIENENINFIGYVSNMNWFYSLMDCVVLPSYWEGMSLVQLESLYLEIPLICSDAPGINELGENDIDCLFVNPGDVNDLADKILILYNSGELADKLRLNGKKRVEDISVDSFKKELLSFYGKIMDNRNKNQVS